MCVCFKNEVNVMNKYFHTTYNSKFLNCHNISVDEHPVFFETKSSIPAFALKFNLIDLFLKIPENLY